MQSPDRPKFIRIVLTMLVAAAAYAGTGPTLGTGAAEVETALQNAQPDTQLTVARTSFGTAGEFRFITPIAPNPHDQNADFDADLLPYLTVKVCKVNGPVCSLVKTFTSTTSADRLRIEKAQGSYFIANWNTGVGFDNTPVYRISVEVPGETLGTVDLPPSAYRQWGRTWPIKFIVEKDPELRIRLLAAAGNTIWDVADNLRSTLGICGEDLRVLLRTTYPNATDSQVQQVVNSVCQDVILAPNTRIADAATRDALASYDMASGLLIFANETTLLKNLRNNDVLVSKPNAIAPYGYLRKVTSVRKDRGVYFVESVQATLTEAIQKGTLDASGELLPGDELPEEPASSNSGFRLSESASADAGTQSADSLSSFCTEAGGATGYSFECNVDETFDFQRGIGEFEGTGHVRVAGKAFFSAGFDVGVGIEFCARFPIPACMDRFEARLRVRQKSELRIEGTLDARVKKEIVVGRKIFRPITFWLGPIPVVIFPVANLVVGASGDAHLEFDLDASTEASFAIGAKWTDPGDGGQGWQNVSERFNSTGDANGSIEGNINLVGYYKGNGKLFLYGIAGPSFGAILGGRVFAQVPRQPAWTIYARIAGDVAFEVSIIDVITLSRFSFDEWFYQPEPVLANAPNLRPRFSNVTQNFDARMNVSTLLGPRTGGLGSEGYFDVADPEGGPVTLSGVSSNANDNDDFAIVNGRLRVTFRDEGPREITVTARDAQGLTATQKLNVNVVNAAPEIFFTTVVFNFPAGVQYFLTAQVIDPESGRLPCSALTWTVSAPTVNIKTESADNRSCTVAVVFNALGDQSITATAVDPQGKTFSRMRPVNVTNPPTNPAPIIDVNSFLVRAAEGPMDPIYCATGFWCEAPEGAELFNGEVGDYRTPLELSLSVSDPQGETAWVKEWRCLTGPGIYTLATDNGDGTFGCSPFVAAGGTIAVFAIVTDGTNDVVSEVRTFTMRRRINPN